MISSLTGPPGRGPDGDWGLGAMGKSDCRYRGVNAGCTACFNNVCGLLVQIPAVDLYAVPPFELCRGCFRGFTKTRELRNKESSP